MNIDIQNGIATYTPPIAVAGEVATRVLGLTINEWFYVAAIACMLVSAISSAVVAILRVTKGGKE